MSQPNLQHPNVVLTNITEAFHNAAQSLPSGQVVKDEDFTLFEAVGALEMGDPKMDSGCVKDEDDFEDDFDVTRDLSPEELIWLIDELTCREIAWHQGYPLSQTVFTSIYIDRILWPDPKHLFDAHFIRDSISRPCPPLQEILRSYCICLVKCCDLVLAMVTGEHYYEEEDFATQTFNREMLHRFSVDDVRNCMTGAFNLLDQINGTAEVLRQLKYRLILRSQIISLLEQNTIARKPDSDSIERCLEAIGSIREAPDLGKPLPDAFSLKLQRKLASSVPPRPMVSTQRSEALEFFERLLKDVSGAFELLSVNFSGDITTAFWTLMSQVPQPSVYVRALVQSFLHIHGRILGRVLDHECIIEDLRQLTLPATLVLDPANKVVENPNDNRFRISSQINQFVIRISPSFINLFRSFCQNRCRIRRILCHGALEWDSIQADAEEIDGYLQTLVNEKAVAYPKGEEPTYSYPLSSWIYHNKLIQLRYVVQMGFELSIYAPHEYASMYWYLSHLSSLHLSHLERISYFITAQTQPPANMTANAINQEKDDAIRWLFKHFGILKATDTLACALHRVYILLQRHGHFTKVTPTYASEELRFELRMRPFQHLSIPEPLTYEQMDRLSNLSTLSDREILEQASRLCAAAKKSWEEVVKQTWNFKPTLEDAGSTPTIDREWAKDVRSSLKACIGTSIAVMTLMKVYEEGIKSKKSGEFLKNLKVVVPPSDDTDRFHRWWAIPKIAR